MLLGGTKDEHFSCFLSSCQLGSKYWNNVNITDDKWTFGKKASEEALNEKFIPPRVLKGISNFHFSIERTFNKEGNVVVLLIDLSKSGTWIGENRSKTKQKSEKMRSKSYQFTSRFENLRFLSNKRANKRRSKSVRSKSQKRGQHDHQVSQNKRSRKEDIKL